ncbi:MAG: hypothetical protein JSU95_09860 [Betaproteobacteria bacterium]|nr:MAG: hypothetical protein JSU95_09860 [Betaproteobacteria bacterium]
MHNRGVADLIGSTIRPHLRLTGAWRWLPLAPPGLVLARSSASWLSLAVVFGFLLFILLVKEYVAAGLFVPGMVVIATRA